MTMTGRCRPCEALEGAMPVVVMVINQVSYGGVNIFCRFAAEDGMNLRIAVAYRLLFGTAFLVPLALVMERNKRPKLTWMVFLQAFCCALLGGTLGQNLNLASIALTSATYGTAMNNLIPAFTFVFAIFLGMEKLMIKSAEGMAKVIGTLMGIGGAMVLTFYKGFEIRIWPTNPRIIHHGGSGGLGPSHAQSGSLLAGSMLAVGSSVSYAMFLIFQAKLAMRYPCHFSSTAMMLSMSAIQGLAVALCGKGEWNEWKLGWNVRLLAVSYMGIVGSGISLVLSAWCVHKRGPLFGAVFNPLCLVFVGIVGSIILGETLHLGSLMGAGLIVGGLYLVVWGKSKEMKMSESHTTPLQIYQPSSPSSTAVVENAMTSHKDRDRVVVEGSGAIGTPYSVMRSSLTEGANPC